MYSWALFPASVPAATSARNKSPAEICVNPYCVINHPHKEELAQGFRFFSKQVGIQGPPHKCNRVSKGHTFLHTETGWRGLHSSIESQEFSFTIQEEIFLISQAGGSFVRQQLERETNTFATISSHCVPFPDAGAPEIIILKGSFPAKACTPNCATKQFPKDNR
jgi:hypothetical protein